MGLFRAGAHAAGKDAEVGNLAFAAIGDRCQPIVLRFEAGQQLLARIVEAVGQAMHAACQHGRAPGPVGRQRNGGFGQHVIQLGLKEDGALVDRFFARLTASVGVEGQQDDEGDDAGVGQRQQRKRW